MEKDFMKSKIIYSRAYRHFKTNYIMMGIYFVVFAIPILALYLLNYTKLTRFVSEWAVDFIREISSNVDIKISYGEFLPFFGGINFVELPSKIPSNEQIFFNIIVIIFLLIFSFFIRKKAMPFSIYLNIILLVHMISCLFFLFIPDKFPYTLSEYSELYMKQQVGIWLALITIAVFILGNTGYSGFLNLIFYFAVAAYSYIFGLLRYSIILMILWKASSLYMALLFFFIGPFLDYFYFVFIYTLYIKFIIKKNSKRGGEIEWHWA